MALVSVPADELKAMDRTIREQGQLLREQEALLERIMELMKPLIEAGKEQQAPPAPGSGECTNMDQMIRSGE